jgi:steroid 5-alpha reductase family enzyme
MKGLVKTIVILLFTVIAIPLVTIYVDEPLTALQREALTEVALMALVAALLCFTVSELTGNCSQVDKLWSILPIIYVWHMAYKGGFDNRLVLMAGLATLWGIRLTYNFSRRGAYKLKFWTGEEDYRWEILRNNPTFKGYKIRWTLFNLFFISLYQNALILAFTLPMIVLIKYPGHPIGLAEIILAAISIGLVIIETVADQQQWNFHKEKNALKAASKPLTGAYADGFVHTGLWGKVRHPNYAAEQAIWVVFYLFSVVAAGQAINWSMAGCLLLLILFQGSSDFSEGISAGKYPAYKAYQQRVGRFLPKLW